MPATPHHALRRAVLLGPAGLMLPAVLAVAALGCAHGLVGDSSPPPHDGGVPDVAPPEDSVVDASDGAPGDGPSGSCQLTGHEQSLGSVPVGHANQALAWDGSRLAIVYQVQPGFHELRFAATDGNLAAVVAPATFTEGLVDCSAAVLPCHAAPAVWADAAGAFAVLWAGFDPGHSTTALYFAHLDASGRPSGFTTAVPGGVDRPVTPDLCGVGSGYVATWQLGQGAHIAALDLAGAASGEEALSAPAETVERPRLACAGGAAAAAMTLITGADRRSVAFRARPPGGPLGGEFPVNLAPLIRPRAVALRAEAGGFVLVVDGEAPAGQGTGAAYVALLGPGGEVTGGPYPAVTGAADEGLIIESATLAPNGDVAIVGTSYTSAGAHVFFQLVSRLGQARHAPVDVSAGQPSLASQAMGALVAALPDRFAISFVAVPTPGAGLMSVRTVTCDR
jgi:hypothetical protein